MPKLKWAEVAAEIDEAYIAMWHNASMLGVSGPDFADNAEAEHFQIHLNFYAEAFCECLSKEIKANFGLDWTLCQYGRGGATIAPHEIAQYGEPAGQRSHVCEDLVSFYDWHEWGGPGWSGEALQDYNRDYAILLGLRYVNRAVKAAIGQDWSLWWRYVKGEEVA